MANLPRQRILSPEFFRDEDIGDLTAWARLCFMGMWTIADKEGRLEDRPRRITAELFPYENKKVDVEPLLAELAKDRNCSPGAFITRYSADGRNYIQINKFLEYQRPHHREPESKIPAKPVQARESPGQDVPSPLDPVSDPVSDPVKDKKGGTTPPVRPSAQKRAASDPIWFTEAHGLQWEPEWEQSLAEEFPALSQKLVRDGLTWRDKLHALSRWHETAPPSKRKKVSAYRWLKGRLFPEHERKALHAAQHKPAPTQSPAAEELATEAAWEEARPDNTADIAACEKEHGPHVRDRLTQRERYAFCSCGYREDKP